MNLQSDQSRIRDGQRTAQKITRFGENLFPPLKWTGTPEGTESFRVDRGGSGCGERFVPPLRIINIPAIGPSSRRPSIPAPERGIKFMKNDFGNARYDGPQPPSGNRRAPLPI